MAFPGSGSQNGFWKNMSDGAKLQTVVIADEYKISGKALDNLAFIR